MKSRIFLGLVLGLSASFSANASVIPYGIQSNVSDATVASWGWTECHRSDAKAISSSDMSACNGDYIMMGAWDASLGAYGVVGAGETSIVTAITYDTHDDDDVDPTLNNWSNGLNWYRTASWGSWGFTTIGETALNSADLLLQNGANAFSHEAGSDAGGILAAGLSWHISSSGDFTTGWAYNSDGSNFNSLFSDGDQRVFWTININEVPEPSSLALLLMGGFAFARYSRKSKAI